MHFVECEEAQHASSILAIFNEAIVHTTALYDYVPRTEEKMAAWFASKRQGSFPVLGAVAPDGRLAGFASYGPFRPHPAYKYTVEHSVYVEKSFRGQGLGRELLQRLITRAQEQQFHNLIGVIDAENAVSIQLHQKLGFVECGVIRHAGFKFGRWLDVVFYQLLLATPEAPVDG